jgi:hypothetical protein
MRIPHNSLFALLKSALILWTSPQTAVSEPLVAYPGTGSTVDSFAKYRDPGSSVIYLCRDAADHGLIQRHAYGTLETLHRCYKVLHLSPCEDGNFVAHESASKLTRDVVDKVKVAKYSSDSGGSLKRRIG